jgi:hypothetical protein
VHRSRTSSHHHRLASGRNRVIACGDRDAAQSYCAVHPHQHVNETFVATARAARRSGSYSHASKSGPLNLEGARHMQGLIEMAERFRGRSFEHLPRSPKAG